MSYELFIRENFIHNLIQFEFKKSLQAEQIHIVLSTVLNLKKKYEFINAITIKKLIYIQLKTEN